MFTLSRRTARSIPDRHMRHAAPFVLLLALSPACADSPAATEPAPEPRTFAMGWAPTPPRLDSESVLATAASMARVSEYALVQRPVPWARLLAGDTLANVLEEEAQLADFLRQRYGLEIVWLVDPLDGLDRRQETRELVEAGRSIREPEIRDMHVAWTLAVVERVEPEYLGLASEVNTLGAHGDPALYDTIASVINEIAAEARTIHPETRVFVSFQVDDAWDLLLPTGFDHFALIDDFDVDALGLSSYPSFVFDDPSEIPDDYFRVFRDHTDLPLLMVEGGWSSEPVPWGGGSVVEQAEFFRRFETLLDGVDARLWVFLLYADLDLEQWGLEPDDRAVLENFAHMGIVDTDLQPRSAYTVWARIFGRPLGM